MRGKIIRSGYVPHRQAYSRYGSQYAARQQAYASPHAGTGQPIIEVRGELRFGVPGQPLFPSLADDTILKPTLDWLVQSDQAGPFDAEMSYITGGLSWEADYNLVAPGEGDKVNMVGWITMDNQSGKSFQNARIKLMAGDVSKIQTEQEPVMMARMMAADRAGRPEVTEKAFDEYHLYTLERPATLRDRQTKQVEFVRAAAVESNRFYVYDGVKIPQERYRYASPESIRQDVAYGSEFNRNVWVMREFRNAKENGLGLPLPKGRVRFYRQDEGGAPEFTGEDLIAHTPRDEIVRVYTGNAFDLVGERRRTDYKIDHGRRWLVESFEILLRNRKKEAVEVRIVEHLYRGTNWELKEKSSTFSKIDSQTIEFRIQCKPDEQAKVTYTVEYTW